MRTEIFWAGLRCALLSTLICFGSFGAAFGAESTMPSQYVENIKPELAARYVYTEDGDYTKALNIPTYEWMPAEGPPKTIFLGIHGLTLHGRRFRVLARSLAVNGVGFVALDMRGFGRCHFDPEKRFSTPQDDKTKINHAKSYEDIVALAKAIKAKYPQARLIALGESLGCTFCVKLAGEYQDLIPAIVLSAPATKLNKDMYAGHGQVRQGIKAVVTPHHELSLTGFFADLCSSRVEIQKEMTEDPMILKKLSLGELISTDEFCAKTDAFGKLTSPTLAVLILQGSADGCVSPEHVTKLMNNMPSTDQNLAWRGSFGHLQLETIYMRAQSIDAIADWLLDHSSEQMAKLQQLEQNVGDLGGNITR
ncbi:MAG: alpha/beta fold hydrolase [Candidatus Melainabacteria bacterium]|nr:alpha/beta fold hydrolase [Candidatus Melainabacteria bacterium]